MDVVLRLLCEEKQKSAQNDERLDELQGPDDEGVGDEDGLQVSELPAVCPDQGSIFRME